MPNLKADRSNMHERGNEMKKERNENRKLPDPIPDATPEQVAQVILRNPPKKEWRFMKTKKGNS